MPIFSIHLDAPLLGLQGARIDAHPQGLEIPTRSMMTGLFGAALGLDRTDAETLQHLQDAMRIAVGVRRGGIEIVDYQTADLSKPFLQGPMWWHRPGTGQVGIVERHGAAETRTGRRPHYRRYRADAKMTVLVELQHDAPFSAQHILAALDRPARPLGLGRMSCPPAGRIAGTELAANNLVTAAREIEAELLYLPAELAEPEWGDLFYSVVGTRDWRSGQHSGTDTFIRRPAA